jgi:hypothetical protein
MWTPKYRRGRDDSGSDVDFIVEEREELNVDYIDASDDSGVSNRDATDVTSDVGGSVFIIAGILVELSVRE